MVETTDIPRSATAGARHWIVPIGLLLLVFNALVLQRFESSSSSNNTSKTTSLFRDTGDSSTILLRITNCIEKPLSVGTKKSPFWTDTNTRFMDNAKRAAVAVELMYEYGALKKNNSTKTSTSTSTSTNNKNNYSSTNAEGGRIVDMGSGFLALRDALPSSERHRYLPVDLKERVPGSGTVICNLNEHEFPMLLDDDDQGGVSAFIFLGSFEYILDKMTVLHLCRMHPRAHVVLVSEKHALLSSLLTLTFVLSNSIIRLENVAQARGTFAGWLRWMASH
jgi:hypothetical protein